ncbi:MAG: L-2-amino-thiazoline-4-carboxylic acid hydrolase [Brotaphodocola sp.]
MAFCIKMQPFLADRYYHYLKEKFPEQAMDAFKAAFYRYGTQRGIRAAQRAIRDKAPLNFQNYQNYREVQSTPEMRAIDGPGRSDHAVHDGEYLSHVYVCSCHTLFREMNTPREIEEFYCTHIDRFNVEGFNADIPYTVTTTLYDSPCCTHHAGPCEIEPDIAFGIRMPDCPPYPFIVANEYFTMKQVIEAIWDEEGTAIADAVRDDFIKKYGIEDWKEICKYQNVDFDIHYPKCLR